MVGGELVAHILDDMARRAADRRHPHRAEQIGQQRAQQQADDDIGVGQAEIDRRGEPEGGIIEFEILGIGAEQDERGKPGRADGIALCHRLRRVAHRVERIGLQPDGFVEMAHFRDAAGIVGDRAIGVERHHHARQRQHRGRGEGDADQAGALIGKDDADHDHQRRQRGRLQADGQPLDDVGAMAGFRRLGDGADRAIIGAGIIFGDPHDERGDAQPHHHRPEKGHAVIAADPAKVRAEDRVHVAQHPVGDQVDGRNRQDRRRPEALVERAHDRLGAAETDHEGADDRGDDAQPADDQRQAHEFEQEGVVDAGDQQGGQHHGRAHRDDIGFEQVGRHAGAIADIVAHIVGDDRGVARIVLRYAGLDLAHQVGADIGRLGEDAAAQPRENGDERCAERQRDQAVDHQPVIGRMAGGARQIPEEAADREQRQSRHQHAGDGACAEGDGEAALQRSARRFGGADIGAHRNGHADEAGRARQDRADQEAHRRGEAEE